VPGHQVTGEVVETGTAVDRLKPGARVGVGWIFAACGTCPYCRSGRENLCPEFKATGRDAHGGYAEYLAVDEDFALPLPDNVNPVQAAPLLCAGAVGYRAFRQSGIGEHDVLGLSGFGASAQLLLKTAVRRFPDLSLYVFARNPAAREYARSLGAAWTGDFHDTPPALCNAIIDTTPVWKPIVDLLPRLSPGGRFVINAIRKTNADKNALSSLSYEHHLWMEKSVTSVANVTRSDITQFLELAASSGVVPELTTYSLSEANQALLAVHQGGLQEAQVLVV
ncbi:MAG TPA: alcohol dehydrogenase, partial [Spirochaetia bacterium]|nr:alcohol dehydrogenase [Spirochaetia bacterium]